MIRSLFQNCKFVKVKDPTTAGTSDVTSDAVDMTGYRGVLFASSYGTAAANNIAHAEQSDDDGSADAYNDLAGTELGAGASDEDQIIEIFMPQKRYVRTIWQRGTSSTLGDVWAILFDPITAPVTNNVSGTLYGESSVSPAEGTK